MIGRGVAVAALVVLVAACSAPATTDAGGVVIVGGLRSDSAAGGWTSVLEQYFDADVASGATWTFVTADGRPSTIGSLPLYSDAANDLTRSADLAALRDQARALVSAMRADDPESDLLAALDLAGRTLSGVAGPRVVIVLDSLLSTAGALRFQADDGALLSADPTGVADLLARSDDLPTLTGVTVVLVGAGDTVAPQDALPAPTRSALIALWTRILERAGASVSVVQTPSPPATVVGLPPVSVVPVAAPTPVPGPVSLSDSAVGFLPDQSVLRDPAQAAAVLAPFVARLLATRGRVLLTGTTSSAGTPDGRVALSNDRARAIAGLLVAGGVPLSSIEVHGAGSGFPGFIPDRDAAGTLDPVIAARNRQVIIQPLPG